MIGSSRIAAAAAALVFVFGTTAQAQSFTPFSEITETACNKLVALLSSGTGAYGDYSSNLRWENGRCRVTTTIPRACLHIAMWLGLDPDVLDSAGTWSPVDPRCTNRYDEVTYPFDDPLGYAYIRYYNSRVGIWRYEYNFDGDRSDIYGSWAVQFITKYADSILVKADADALEQAGFSFSVDRVSRFDRDAYIAAEEAADSGESQVFGELIFPHYRFEPRHPCYDQNQDGALSGAEFGAAISALSNPNDTSDLAVCIRGLADSNGDGVIQKTERRAIIDDLQNQMDNRK